MSSNRQNRWLNYGVFAGIAALAAGLLYVLSNQFEQVKMSVNKGYTYEATQNPYLAAQQFLAQKDIQSNMAVDITEASEQLKPEDTLLMLNDRTIPDPYQNTLIDWVESGGHLIIAAQDIWDEDYQSSGDTFLDYLGVRMENALDDEFERVGEAAQDKLEALAQQAEDAVLEELELHEEQEDNTTESNQCNAYGYSKLSSVIYDEDKTPLQVQFGSFTHLEDITGNALSYEGHYPNNILQYQLGNGMITVTTAYTMWNNSNIAWYDHAYFLWLLAGNTERVWFIFDKDSDSLFALITRHLLEPFVAGLTLLFLWLWYRAKRFGPIIPEPEKARRSLLEHLNANAKFNWRHQQLESLIKKQREDIKSHYTKRHGNHHKAEAIFAALAKSSQLTTEDVEWALTTETPYKEQEYTQLIKRLQRLRNAV